MPTNVVKCEIRSSEDGQWYFVGVAGNGEIVVTSEMYTKKDDASDAAVAVFPGVARVSADPVSVDDAEDDDDGA